GPTLSSRHLLPGSSSQQAPELGVGWIPGTRLHEARDDKLAAASEAETSGGTEARLHVWRASMGRLGVSDLGGAIPDRVGVHGIVGNLLPEVAVVLECLVAVVELLEGGVGLVDLGVELLC